MEKSLSLVALHPSDYNPRTVFPDDYIAELAASIRDHGVLNALIVRHRAEGGFEIIAGESRWLAAEKAGLAEVPCRVLEIGDDEAVQLALIDNIKRAELTPLDEARGYRLIMQKLGWDAKTAADKIGVSRSHVYKRLQLLELPADITDQVRGGAIAVTHAQQLARLHEHSEQLYQAAAAITDGSIETADQLANHIDLTLDRLQRAEVIAELRAALAADPDESYRQDPSPQDTVAGSAPINNTPGAPTWRHYLENLDFEHECDYCVDAVAERAESGKWQARTEIYYDRAEAEALLPEPAESTDSTGETPEPDPVASDCAAEAEAIAQAAAPILKDAATDAAHCPALCAYLLNRIVRDFDSDARIAEAMLAARDITCSPDLAAEEIHDTFEKWLLTASTGELNAALIEITLRDPFEPQHYLRERLPAAAQLTGTKI